MNANLRESIVRNLAALAALGPVTGGNGALLKRAAVCLIVADDMPHPTLIITRRSSKLNAHAGQFAFPGGRVDAGETIDEAALRETQEEVGLTLAQSDILGRLDEYPTRSGYLITPLVAWLPAGERGTTMKPNPDEVAAIYRIPLVDLEMPGSPEFVSIPESTQPVIRYPLLNTRIHAPSAALMYQLMEVAIHGRMTRVAHLEQPVWAWR